MKTRTIVSILILVLAIMVIAGSCTTMKSPDKMVYERFCGTWANQDYEPKPGMVSPMAKVILNPDGTFVYYQYLIQTGPNAVGTYTVEKRWKDADGNSFYHVETYSPLSTVTQYELWKIDKYAAVFEFNYSNIDYPEAIDPKDKRSTYRIYYRY